MEYFVSKLPETSTRLPFSLNLLRFLKLSHVLKTLHKSQTYCTCMLFAQMASGESVPLLSTAPEKTLLHRDFWPAVTNSEAKVKHADFEDFEWVLFWYRHRYFSLFVYLSNPIKFEVFYFFDCFLAKSWIFCTHACVSHLDVIYCTSLVLHKNTA